MADGKKNGSKRPLEIAQEARDQLAQLIGRRPEGILGVEREEDEDSGNGGGWRVTLEVLELREPWLTGMLEALDGRVEMTVSAMYREDVLLGEVIRDDPGIAKLREQIQGKPAAATHFERIRLGELVAQSVDARRRADGAAILDALRPAADAFVPGEMLHERMVVNTAFLVRRDQLDGFDSAVERVSAERADRMQFKLTGPLPPVSFVNTEEPAWA